MFTAKYIQHSWWLSTARDDPWRCHDAHIFPSISAKHTPEQHWKALGWGCYPVWLHVEYQKACLHAPRHLEKTTLPSTKQRKAVEHVAPSMLGKTGLSTRSKYFVKSRFANQISEFHPMLLLQTSSQTATRSIPVPRRKPTWPIEGCKRSGCILAKILYASLNIAIGVQFLVCCKSPLFGNIVNNVCRQLESNCPLRKALLL